MNLLIRAACLLAAGAAGWALARRKSKQEDVTDDPRVVYLDDDEAVIDAPQANAEPEPVAAEVIRCCRRMDPLTLNTASDVTFILGDGTEVRLMVSGEGSMHLQEGDIGMLTWDGDQLILFEKDNGELVGGMYYVPVQTEVETDE